MSLAAAKLLIFMFTLLCTNVLSAPPSSFFLTRMPNNDNMNNTNTNNNTNTTNHNNNNNISCATLVHEHETSYQAEHFYINHVSDIRARSNLYFAYEQHNLWILPLQRISILFNHE